MRTAAVRDDVVVTLWLAPKRPGDFEAGRVAALGARPLGSRSYLSRAELRRTGDADPASLDALEAHLRAAGVAQIERDWRRVRASGSRAVFEQAVRALHGRAFASDVVAVFGLDETTAPESYARASSSASASGFAPLDIARAYRMPAGLSGSGTSIGIVNFAGTYHARDLERAQAAAHLGMPTVLQRSGEGGGGRAAREDDYEIALDTQIAAAVAPAARLLLYRGKNDAGGYADAFAAALLDDEYAPDVISISYGVPEAAWPPEAIALLEQLFIAAALCGVTVVAASGDHGSDVTHGEPSVVYPASSAFVLACGGTKLRLERSRRISEVVWNEGGRASGGGYSRRFPRPAWQASSEPETGRALPDVAGHADSTGGYRIFVTGEVVLIGGTSAVAPLWAGFIALASERLGHRCGLFTPLLYAGAARDSFYDVTSGGNGRYRARPGWDACTGLGSPHFAALLRLFLNAA